ncbi:response regulator [bacterium]|nr:response regulator [bacterium]
MTETLRILIADDEDAMRLVIKRALREFSLSVPDVGVDVALEMEEAPTGEEAVERIAATHPDLVLLDLKLPGISGLEVLEQIKDYGEERLVIMITAYATIQTAVTATKQGAYDFLAKPFTPEELRSTVRKAIRHLILSRQARRLAEEKRRVRFEFISVLAHELKSPINAVEGYLNTLQEDFARNDPAIFDRIVGRSRIRLEGMRKIINDLLDMTRIESGRKKRDITEVDVVDVARMALESVAPTVLERGIEVHLDAPESLTMTADRGEIEIILNNLVSNAVKYNKDNGRVDVILRDTEGRTIITVSDTGIGTSPAEAAKLFNDFVRIKNTKTKHILGSGLGLSIVKKLALLYGGDVSVESQPDVGSAFTVSLHDAAYGETEASPPAQATASSDT